MTRKVITGKVRFSYLTVFSSKTNDLNGNDEFSVVLLIPKSDKTTLDKMEAARQEAIEVKFNGKPPARLKYTLRDGDEEFPDKPECEGMMVVSVKSKQRPKVVDSDLQEVLDPTAVVSGDYGRASITAFAYDSHGSKGVSFGLNHLQFLEAGDPLGGATRAEDDFA